MISASSNFTFSVRSATKLSSFGFRTQGGFIEIDLDDLPSCGADNNFFLKTRGRTVDICGRREGQIIVAMTLPPKVGRVWRNSFFSVSISNPVQSAVNRFSGQRLPWGKTNVRTVWHPPRTISGLYS